MTQSTLDMVVRRRHLVRCVLRAVIILTFGIALLLLLVDFFSMLPYGWQTILDRPFYTFREHLSFAGAFVIVGGCAWWLQKWIARMIVPTPRLECPDCGYALQKLTTSRCPECGFMFGTRSDGEPPAAR